jgi:hypothetical protein
MFSGGHFTVQKWIIGGKLVSRLRMAPNCRCPFPALNIFDPGARRFSVFCGVPVRHRRRLWALNLCRIIVAGRSWLKTHPKNCGAEVEKLGKTMVFDDGYETPEVGIERLALHL